MRIETSREQSSRKEDVVHISILLVVAVCIGIYLIITATLIARDGITFIEYAKSLESAPVKTMVKEYQHPGYPLLILATHKLVAVVCESKTVWSWIYCAQSTALIFRLLGIVVVYFVGKSLVGAKFSFWATLILVLLPKPAAYGSDALSDWPHIFFLSVGFLLLMRGAIEGKWRLFGFVGLAGGAGYLVRPECAQLLVFGSLWLGLQLFWSRRTMNKKRTVFALALLLAGFFVMAGPYMKLKGAVFPKKHVGLFSSNIQSPKGAEQQIQAFTDTAYTAGFAPSKIVWALGELIEKTSDVLMWFFVLPLLIGMHKRFKKRQYYEPEKFFITALIALNIALLIWLYCKHSYISSRHTLLLVVFTVFFIPAGLQAIAFRLQEKLLKKMKRLSAIKIDEHFWFSVLFIIGVSICAFKLLRPIRIDKQGYRAAAKWLKANTKPEDIIAVPDKRISFYAERKGLLYENGKVPENAVYIVKISKRRIGEAAIIGRSGKIEYEYVDERDGKTGVVIYRKL